MQISKRRQELRVAYQGIPGAFSEGAAHKACPDHEPLPCEQFETAFQALSQWMADRACMPIENSLGGAHLRTYAHHMPHQGCALQAHAAACSHRRPKHEDAQSSQMHVYAQSTQRIFETRNLNAGSIHTVYDLLLRYNLHIVGEKYVPISHCLMANPGVDRADLKRVLSHPQALAQCDDYLRNLGVVREAVDDTAGAPTTYSILRLHPS